MPASEQPSRYSTENSITARSQRGLYLVEEWFADDYDERRHADREKLTTPCCNYSKSDTHGTGAKQTFRNM